jgi:sec-independent protein translocase protein TatA
MGSFSIWHWLIVLLVILLLFGGGSKLSTLMGDLAKGIKSFKKNMSDEEKDASMAADAPPAPGTQSAGSIPGPTTTTSGTTTHGTGRPTENAAAASNTSRPAA